MYFNGTKCYSLLFCLLPFSLTAKDTKQVSSLQKPLCFVENKGQLADQNNKDRNDIQYTLSAPGMDLFIGNGQMHYQFKKLDGKGANAKLSTYRMDVSLAGANPNAAVTAENGQAYYENYFTRSASAEAITAHSWNRIVYKDVYPNIDWVLYVKNDKVEYDFNVRPGGNVSDIKLVYAGANSLAIANDGGIVAETPMGAITEKKPYSFEPATGREVASSFRVKGNTVTFETAPYKDALTIDPYLLWSTYFGGGSQDEATCVAIDATHNTYVGGYTASAGLATGGAYRNAFLGGAFDAFVAKYNNAGTIQFVSYYGGPASDQGTCIAVDASGVYLGGFTNSPAMVASFGAYHGALNGGNDGFLVKLNTGGNFRIWGTYFGGAGNDAINGVATDGTNVYVTGQTASAALVATGGAYQTALMGANDAFVAKFSATTGGIQWSTYYGGTAQENGLGIALSPTGVFVTGQTSSVINMASPGAYQSSLSGTNDAFIAEFNTAGTRVWGTYYGGPGTEQGNGIAYDPVNGNIAVIGNTTSTSAIATPNTFQTSLGGLQDAFVTYFNSAGARLWGSYYGGSALDYGQGICFDPYGNILVAGGTFSSNNMAGVNSFQPAIGGDYDAFLAKINNLGQTIWNTYFGGTFYDYANGVACDANEQIVLAGYTSSLGNYGAGGLSTVGSAQAAYGGAVDGFVTRFKADTFLVINRPFKDTLVCAGGILNVSYTVFIPGATFQPGNTFTVQLSNAAGSFAAPVAIGSTVANSSGTIACTIPAGTPLGTGYRIRVVASNPGFISPDDDLNIRVVASISDASAYSNTPVCVGATIKLFDNPTYSVTSYSWSGPAGFSSGLQNPTISSVTLANAGTYTVTTTHNGCPATTATTTVVVNNVIPPTPTVGAGSTACAGGSISLSASPGAVSGVTWYWVGPGGYTSTMQNPTITGATTANTGTYFVQDTLAGCASAFASVYITILPVLPVSVTITASAPYVDGTPGDTICNGTMVSFVAHPVNEGSAPTYQWMTGPTSPVIGAISATWASSTLVNGQTIFCQLNSSADCPSPAVASSNVITMNVITNEPIVYIAASPSAHVPPGSSITFTSTVYDGGIGPMYQWTKNGVAIPGAINSTYTLTGVTHNDTIGLLVTSTMNCSVPPTGTSNILVVGTNVGVTNITANFSNVELFPNPSNGTFTVKGSVDGLEGDAVSFEVTNLLGQVVYSSQAEVHNGEISKTVQLQNVTPGIYFLRVGQGGASKAFRFSVQK